jgi:lysophospholipase L1-like esterase
MKAKYIGLSLAIMGMMASCKTAFNDLENVSAGEADFSKYVAIGNSLTAGFQDNSLTRQGQIESYPNMLAQQFKLANGSDFKQPLLPGNFGWPSAKLVLSYKTDCTQTVSLGPVINSQIADTAGSSESVASESFNNLGLPGVKLAHITVPGYGMLNPYAKRILKSPASQTLFELYVGEAPSFFTLWLGSNDVLGYATSGGEGNVSGMGLNDITNPEMFAMLYDSLVTNLVKTGAKGVLINIPNVTSIPFFTTVPTSTTLTTEQAAALTAAYHANGLTHINFTAGNNNFVIEDANVGARHMTAGEYLILSMPTDSLKCGGWGTVKPIPKKYVLDKYEVEHVANAILAYNRTISAIAAKHKLALFDANSFLGTMQTGIVRDGVNYTPTFVSGGAFSLDGVHLTSRGYAIVTNELIKVINSFYKSTLPYHNINAYSGVKLP